MNLPVFLAAPHRFLFFAGMLQALLAMLWWTVEMAARAGILPAVPAGDWPAAWRHGVLMGLGVFPFFIFGFTLTTAPRWQSAKPIARAVSIRAFGLMAGGWPLFHASLAWPGLLPPALLLILAGWLLALMALWRVALARGENRSHILAVVGGLTFGALLLLALLLQALGGPPWLAAGVGPATVWLVLLPVFTALCHRMLPFFSASEIRQYRVVRPMALLGLLLVAYAGHAALELAGLPRWTWLFDAPAALIALWLSWAWQLRRGLTQRLLAMLHIAFLWLGLGLSLQALSSLMQWLGGPGFGMAPLHALTLGFFSSAVIGMVSRVSLGHSGRPLAADALVWSVFWGVQWIALLRVSAQWLPEAAQYPVHFVAGLGWLVVFSLWFGKFAPIYLKTRPDGRPG